MVLSVRFDAQIYLNCEQEQGILLIMIHISCVMLHYVVGYSRDQRHIWNYFTYFNILTATTCFKYNLPVIFLWISTSRFSMQCRHVKDAAGRKTEPRNTISREQKRLDFVLLVNYECARIFMQWSHHGLQWCNHLDNLRSTQTEQWPRCFGVFLAVVFARTPSLLSLKIQHPIVFS